MSPRSPLCFVAVVLALAALAPPAVADVIVVALDGSGDALNLSDALNLADPGDILLVREGNYAGIGPLDPDGFHYINEAVTIIGDGAGPSVGMMRIFDIPAGQEVVLRNLKLSGPFPTGIFLEKLGVRDCAGTVLVEDCTLSGVMGTFSHIEGFPGADVRNSAGVTFTRCTIRGGMGMPVNSAFPPGIVPGPGGPALVVDGSKVALQHCTVIGGTGGTDQIEPIESKPGGDGLIIAESATVFAAGGSIAGGKASNGGSPELPLEAAGGDGIVQTGSFSTLRLIGVTPQGGAGGVMSDASTGPDGLAMTIAAGSLETFGELARGTSLPATLNLGELATLGISGAPGELAKVMVGLDVLHAQLGGKKGVFNLTGGLIGPVVLGVVPPSGVLELPVSFPSGSLLGLEGLCVHMQGLTFGAEGLMFGNPTTTLVLVEGL
ncbi:MAG TPA: hypothetical protein VFD43_02985 [Planctomycetota bacterium]|nr:hypothetical protein [Planctomycetota bacterium]